MRLAAAVVTVAMLTSFAVYGAQKKKEKGEETAAPSTGAIQLFNGENLDGWTLFIPDKDVDPKTVWTVKDGVIHCSGKPHGYIRTNTAYENYKLSFDWRWPENGGNSGLLMHIQNEDKVWPKSIEGQLMTNHAADFFVIDGSEFKEHIDLVKKLGKPDERRVPRKNESNEKPLGEWNHYEAVCDGNTIKLYINGLLQNEATETNISKGYIGLQSEGTPIEFKNIVLEPLR